MKDFLAAIATRGKPVADIEQGYISTASCILANMAMKLGRTLAWDAAAGRVVRTRRPTGCCAGRTASRGCIRNLTRSKNRPTQDTSDRRPERSSVLPRSQVLQQY